MHDLLFAFSAVYGIVSLVLLIVMIALLITLIVKNSRKSFKIVTTVILVISAVGVFSQVYTMYLKPTSAEIKITDSEVKRLSEVKNLNSQTLYEFSPKVYKKEVWPQDSTKTLPNGGNLCTKYTALYYKNDDGNVTRMEVLEFKDKNDAQKYFDTYNSYTVLFFSDQSNSGKYKFAHKQFDGNSYKVFAFKTLERYNFSPSMADNEKNHYGIKILVDNSVASIDERTALNSDIHLPKTFNDWVSRELKK